MKAQIIPAILVDTQDAFFAQIEAITPATNFVQIDLMDGTFVSGNTWADPSVIREKMPLDFELHLMVNHPEEKLQAWKNIPQLKRIIVHLETLTHPKETLIALREMQAEIVLCLNPGTSTDGLDELVDLIDGVQLMSVEPGAQGRPFETAALKKAAQIHERYPDLPLAADGSVNADTIPQLFAAGVRRFGVGSAIWTGNPAENFAQLSQIIHTLTQER